jgi:hypothetical protein
MIQTLTNAPDAILDEYHRLSLVNEIDNPQAHAEEWRSLAIIAALEDRIATSMNCMTRVLYWQSQVPCIRLVEGSFSELIPTHQTDEIPGIYDWQARKDLE